MWTLSLPAGLRQPIVDAGAIEALVGVIHVHGVRRHLASPAREAQQADLDAAARALGWVIAGTDSGGAARRERAATLRLIPLALQALDRWFSARMADQMSLTLQLLCRDGTPQGPVDEERMELLNSEVQKRPELLEKIDQLQKAQQQKAQQDAEQHESAHEAGQEVEKETCAGEQGAQAEGETCKASAETCEQAADERSDDDFFDLPDE